MTNNVSENLKKELAKRTDKLQGALDELARGENQREQNMREIQRQTSVLGKEVSVIGKDLTEVKQMLAQLLERGEQKELSATMDKNKSML